LALYEHAFELLHLPNKFLESSVADPKVIDRINIYTKLIQREGKKSILQPISYS